MNHREEPHLPAGARKGLYVLALLLVPALGLEQGHAGPRQGSLFPRRAEPTPYLPVVGSPALRLAEVPPPPDLVTRPAPIGPPVPMTERTVPVEAPLAPAVAPGPELSLAANVEPPPSPATESRSPAPILPDTAHAIVHAEDFLPYFQIPGSARHPGDVTLLAPGAPAASAPPPVPASSATYTQSPR